MATITIEDFKANTKEWLIDKLQSMSKDDALQSICNIHDRLHIKYPKTYEECCKVLGNNNFGTTIIGYRSNILINLKQLLVCRDAYWKIAGKQIGLNKAWEPDLQDKKQTKYVITNVGHNIAFERYAEYNAILAFPTSEMRDIFYNNFKSLIEECKKLL